MSNLVGRAGDWFNRNRVRNSIALAAVVVLIIVTVWGATSVFGADQAQATTRNVEVTTGTMQETVTGSGTVAAKSTENLDFAVSGEVTAVLVSAGESVKKNEVLARIDSAALETKVAQGEASVASAEARLSSDEDAGASDAQINADQASLTAARSDLAVAESDLADATLRAPIKGTVAALNLVEGQFVSGGASASGSAGGQSTASGGTSVGATTTQASQIQVISTGSWTVDLSVDDTQIAKVSEGDQATVTVGGVSERVFGTVSSVGLVASTSSGVSSFPVVVTITGSPEGLYAGMSAEVSIVYHQLNNVLQVSSLAISRSGDTQSVQLVAGTGTETREVTTGVTAGGQTQILTGLSSGDEVQITVPAAVGGGGGMPGGGSGGGFQRGGFPGRGGGLPSGSSGGGFPGGGAR